MSLRTFVIKGVVAKVVGSTPSLTVKFQAVSSPVMLESLLFCCQGPSRHYKSGAHRLRGTLAEFPELSIYSGGLSSAAQVWG